MDINQRCPHKVFSWSIAGNETCVAVHTDTIRFGFDLGFSPPPLVYADHVFISHGHTDHIGAIGQHVKKRKLNHLPPACYYLNPALLEPVQTICRAFHSMNNGDPDDFDCKFIPITPNQEIDISDNWSVKAFETQHTVQSQGYLLYRRLSDNSKRPEIAYTGDTRFSVFQKLESGLRSDLLNVRLLIMEATYITNPDVFVAKARKHGHIHLDEIRKNVELFTPFCTATEIDCLIHQDPFTSHERRIDSKIIGSWEHPPPGVPLNKDNIPLTPTVKAGQWMLHRSSYSMNGSVDPTLGGIPVQPCQR